MISIPSLALAMGGEAEFYRLLLVYLLYILIFCYIIFSRKTSGFVRVKWVLGYVISFSPLFSIGWFLPRNYLIIGEVILCLPPFIVFYFYLKKNRKRGQT